MLRMGSDPEDMDRLYQVGQHYEAHTDYFEAEQFEHRDPAMMSNLDLRSRIGWPRFFGI